MPLSAATTQPKRDFMASVLTVVLMVTVAAYTMTYDQFPGGRTPMATVIAVASLWLAFTAATLNIARALPLTIALCTMTFITTLLQWAEIPQDFTPLLRYLTAIAALFVIRMMHMPDMRRFLAYVSMIVMVYAGYVVATGGPFPYAGTIRTYPFWSGLANTSFLIAGMLILIALSPIKNFFKVVWVGYGLYLLAGYGAVTAMLMTALFFGGWYFLYRGWKMVWLYVLGLLAVVGGIFFRNANSTAGADIGTLGVGAIGSGRLDSWFGRLAEFGERPFATQIVGRGPYSDYEVTDLWYWAAKNAHSDIITLLMEFGLFGLLTVLILWITSYKRTDALGQVALLAIALGAASSNTFLDRPAVSVTWGLILYACGHKTVGKWQRRADRIVQRKERRPKLSAAHERLFEKLNAGPR
jgi:hypothetical protein